MIAAVMLTVPSTYSILSPLTRHDEIEMHIKMLSISGDLNEICRGSLIVTPRIRGAFPVVTVH
jgi:hypothetical protein